MTRTVGRRRIKPRFQLVDDWRDAWRWVSVNCMLLASALQGAWLYVPDDLRSSVPPTLIHVFTVALLVCGVIGRVIKQKPRCRRCRHADPDR